MITDALFQQMLCALGDQGRSDIEWAERLGPPADADEFACEVIYVICNSGMKHAIAVGIYERCRFALAEGQPVIDHFKHAGKAAAIETIWRDRRRLFAEFMTALDKVAYAKTLPWIGGITAFHVAKNFGEQVAKPDVHLKRLADLEGVTAQSLCERLAAETGYKVAAVDTILWRACATGILNSKTGALQP